MNQFGISPLHYACYFDSRKAIDLLLDLGANINARDQEGGCPLHYAINNGSIKTIKKLLLRGADKSIKRNDGKTPLDLAVESNQVLVIKILESKSCLRKYICMDSEIEAFRPSRNDLFLIIGSLVFMAFKFIYILKIRSMLFQSSPEKSDLWNLPYSFREEKSEKDYSDYVNCMFDSDCIFETLITFISLGINIFVIVIVFYFMCCSSVRTKKKIQTKSLIVN